MLIKATRSGIVLLTFTAVTLFLFLVSLVPSSSVPAAHQYAKQLTSDAKQLTSDAYEAVKNAAGEYGKNWQGDSAPAKNPDVGAVLAPSKDSGESSKDESSKDESSKDAPKKEDDKPKETPKKITPSPPTKPVQGSQKYSDEPPSEREKDAKFKQDKDLLDWNQVFSQSTSNGAYWPIVFDDLGAMNPNFIPHWSQPDTWITVAQRFKHTNDNQFWFTELVCNAVFKEGKLQCTRPPTILPIAATKSKKCAGPIGHFNLNVGPHDARVFYGPDNPFIIYGSNSRFNCFGLWAQDFRMLADWNQTVSYEGMRYPVDLQRPSPYGAVEKNWFMFWGNDNKTYLHHDVVPHRVFTRLNNDGSIGRDIAKGTRASDDKCMRAFTPPITESESIHQATNSLSITLCRRADEDCVRTPENTFIMHIFQHKSYEMYHGVYEPYVMLFNQREPFGMHAISKKPFWITGRKKAGELEAIPKEQTEMVYVTSINWKGFGQKYHGYLDDVIMMGFGVEDQAAAGIDVLASDLLGDLNYCANLA